MMFEPVASAIAADVAADATVVPFTVTIALASVTVGATVVDVTVSATLDVYEVVLELKDGLRDPAETTRLESVAVVDAAPRVTVTV
jgi:hypothetical protein